MTTYVVNTHEAKSRLSELIREAEQGAEVIVARNGQPVARIVPWTASTAKRVAGSWSGQLEYSSDLVGSDPEILEMFEPSTDVDSL